MRKLLLLSAAIIFLSQNGTMAQSAGINFMLGFPRGEFHEVMGRTGIGGSGEITFGPPGMPFSFGLNLGYLMHGRTERRASFSLTIQEVTVDVITTNQLVNFHLMFKIVPPINSPVLPYLDILFGGQYLWTSSKIEENWYSGNEEVASDVNYSDWAWSYGGGGGLWIRLGGMARMETFLDLKVRYLYGTEATYLREGDLYYDESTNPPTLRKRVSKSETDLLTVHLGVAFRFSMLPF